MKHNRRYKLTVEDEAHLSEVVSGRFSRHTFWLSALLFLLLSFVIAGLIIVATPLRTLLPGYMKASQRSATEEGLLRLDSLMQAYERNEQYMRNYMRVTDTERQPGDSAAVQPVSRELHSDSLSTASELEQKFVRRMEERERYNISVLAPLAAEGVSFSPISNEGIFTADSRTDETGVLLMTPDEGVQCAADGTVIALYHSGVVRGYVIVVQHNQGFVTSYGGTGTPLVGTGDMVNSGQMMALAPQPDSKGARKLQVRMWHNGTPLIPYEYLNNPGRGSDLPDQSFEAPRGK